VSMGLAQYGRRSDGRVVLGEPEALLRAADAALLAAKAAGKGRIRSWHELPAEGLPQPVLSAGERGGAGARRGGDGPDSAPGDPPEPGPLPASG